MSNIVTWNYRGDADVVYGEVHISKAPKIILAITITIVTATCVSGFLLRDFIYDALTNPQIVLKNVSQDENGFYVEIPYEKDSVEFIAEDYIDTVNTRDYESFVNPDNTSYSYTIDENVDTSNIGDYVVTYISKNRIKNNTTTLTVKVKDITSPVITLKDPKTGKELAKTSDGVYYGVSLHRNTDETVNWKAEDYVMSIVDNYADIDNIKITYPEKPDFDNSTEDNVNVTYIAIDDSGNISETTLKILLLDQNDNSIDLTSLVNKREQEQQLIEQTNRYDNGNNNSQSHPDDSWRDDNWRDTPTNPDGTHTGRNPQIYADPFTWSISRDGDIHKCIAMASIYMHYYDYYGSKAYITSGPGKSYQFEDPGTYTFHWETSTGLSCDQTVTITE